MGKEEYKLEPDNPSNIYYPGQQISGRLNIQTDQPIKVKDTNQSDFTELHSGHHSYPFSLTIPTAAETVLPPSFESHHMLVNNHVRYTITAHIVKAWGRKKKAKHIVIMQPLLDLNNFTDQDLMRPSEFTNTKTICCLCLESKPITGTVRTERKGYVPGDTVVFSAELTNLSGRRIKKSRCQLVMHVTLIAGYKRHVYENKFDKVKHGALDAGGTDVYVNERLNIPPLPPSYLVGSKIIDVQYFIQLFAKPAGPSLNLRVNCEIVVGSIPLRDAVTQHGLTLPPPPLSGSYDHTIFDNIPQLLFEESVFGRSDLGFRKKKGKIEYKKVHFVPQYPYYKWNQQNPADLFTLPQRKDESTNYPRF